MNHPRYAEYLNHRAHMTRQEVSTESFQLWLEHTEKLENGSETVYQVAAGARLAPGWYKNKFAPRTGHCSTFGPFSERHDAENA